MHDHFKTEQEEFWAGKFGDDYIERNTAEALAATNLALFSRILSRCSRVGSLIEFGCNIGLNLRAIRVLRPQIELEGVEINARAVQALHTWGGARQIHHASILDFVPRRSWDIALVKGVLIHINPEYLPQVYDLLYRASGRYVLISEYFNPTPTEVLYRGHAGRLFKRDFAGEMLDAYPDLRVVDYGFVWRRDPMFPQDDSTWFLLEKSPG
jgi:pseudaminic acid biosynthesis-associated methylase